MHDGILPPITEVGIEAEASVVVRQRPRLGLSSAAVTRVAVAWRAARSTRAAATWAGR